MDYNALTRDQQKKMAKQALLQLEQQHFEASINAAIHPKASAEGREFEKRQKALLNQIDLLKMNMAEYLKEDEPAPRGQPSPPDEEA